MIYIYDGGSIVLPQIIWSGVGHAFYMHVGTCIVSLDFFYVPPIFDLY